ncbi:MAG: sugar transferase [Anaerolineales bacterium]|nr:sugar transferase [Anaerolineales bacterium]
MTTLSRPLRWSLSVTERRALLIFGDVVVTLAAAMLALWLWTFTAQQSLTEFLQLRWPWLVFLPAAWLALNLGSYELYHLPRPAKALRDMLTSAGLASGLYLIVYFFAPRDLLPRLAVFYFIIAAAVLGLSWRWLHARLFSLAQFRRRVLVVGAGRAGREIIHALQEFQPEQYIVVGIIDDNPRKHRTTIGNAPVIGGYERLPLAVETLNVSEIVLAINGDIEGHTFQTLLDCRARGVPIVRMTSLYEEITGRVPLDHLNADWVIAAYMDESRTRLTYLLIKRFLDIALALIGLALLAVLLPFIALLIRLESPGPVFYRQTRLGRGGRPFTLYKFRSMVTNAEADGKARWATSDDDRVTKVGAFLRRSRLDEAPQFWNVLRGEMSLVGPRPERPEFIEELEREIPFYRARLIVQPGLTGWAQVNYGYTSTIADAAIKLQWDLYYIKHRSLWFDLLILWRTVRVVLGFKGT